MTLRETIDNPPVPGALIRTPLYAERMGEQVLVRCVLERTAVYELEGERHLALLQDFVPVGELDWVIPAPNVDRERAKRGRAMSLRRKREAPA